MYSPGGITLKIKSVKISNLRAFSDVEVPLDDYTSVVGPNGAGKSTILCALNIFFRETDGASTNLIDLDAEDFHQCQTKQPIEITVTFTDLAVDAQEEFSEYYRSGVLIVTARAEYDEQSRLASVKQYGQRLAMAEFADFFKLYNDGGKAGDLAALYDVARKKFGDLPKVGSKDFNRDALRAYEEAHSDQCVLLPSEDQFYGFSKGANRLARFVQWVYVPAVKDAAKENIDNKNTALGKLLARAVRSKVKFEEELKALREETLVRYREIIGAQQGALDGISKSLSARLTEWAHPAASARLSWTEVPKTSVRVDEPIAKLFATDGIFEGELARFGHGLQRSYLLALLQELASGDDTGAPRLILGCEEPELYQHPPQARHLACVFSKLSEANSQIIVSTHSPHFVSGRHCENVRLVRHDRAAKNSKVSWVSSDAIATRVSEVTGEPKLALNAQIARLHQALQPQLSEMFFTPRLVLVEGMEDVAYIISWMILNGTSEQFRAGGCHIVPVNGKSFLIEPLIVAQKLQISTFIIFDADGNKTKPDERTKHERDNKALLRLVGGDDSKPFPSTNVLTNKCAIWTSNMGDVLKAEATAAKWDSTYTQATKGLGSPTGSYQKNTTHIGDHLAILRGGNTALPSLDKLCGELLDFAKR